MHIYAKYGPVTVTLLTRMILRTPSDPFFVTWSLAVHASRGAGRGRRAPAAVAAGAGPGSRSGFDSPRPSLAAAPTVTRISSHCPAGSVVIRFVLILGVVIQIYFVIFLFFNLGLFRLFISDARMDKHILITEVKSSDGRPAKLYR